MIILHVQARRSPCVSLRCNGAPVDGQHSSGIPGDREGRLPHQISSARQERSEGQLQYGCHWATC